MKRIELFLIPAFLFITIILSVNTVIAQTPLSGTYTIDNSGNGDYLSFTMAINDLDSFGVSGPTVFEVVDSTYNEQIELSTYQGMDTTNTVTFRSQSGNRDGVTLMFTSTGVADNYVVKMFDADYYTFENMSFTALDTTYGYVFNMWASDSVTINNCKITCLGTDTLTSPIRSSYSNAGVNASSHYFTLTNSTLMRGFYSLYYYNYSQDEANNGVIENNSFLNASHYSVAAHYANDLQFNNNYCTSNSTDTSTYAIYMYQIIEGTISNNHIEGTSTWPRYGMYLGYCQGSLSTFMPIVGNRVSLPSPSSQYGIYVYQNLFAEYAHNSVYMAGTNSNGMYFNNGAYNKAKNNIIQVTDGGYGIYVLGSPIYQSDYNNISTSNSANAGYFGGAQATLADWQLVSGFDLNSVSVNAVYSDSLTLKICADSLYGMGTALPFYPLDFEGDLRQNPPCIGADEFLPISEFGFDDLTLCNGDTLVLHQDYYDTVVWNSTDTSKTYQITAIGAQTVSVYDACGSDTSIFTVVSPQVALIGDTNLCEGTTADLSTGISGGTYLWSDGSTDSTLNVSTVGNVSVHVIDTFGCESVDTAIVTKSLDVALPDSTTFCEGLNVTLDAVIPGTYVWSDSSMNSTLSVNIPGIYSVTVTDQNCESSDSVYVGEILNPIAEFADSADYFTVVFTNQSQNATSYLWDFGDTSTDTVESPVHIYPWTTQSYPCYSVELYASNQCGSDTVQHGVYTYTSGGNPDNRISTVINDWTVDFRIGNGYGTTPFWSFGDGDTITARNPTHTYTSLDPYECYMVSVVYGCDYDTAFKEIGVGDYPASDPCDVIDGVLNIAETSFVKIYPNPTTGVFVVEAQINAPSEMTVEVVDVRGMVVFSKSFGLVSGDVKQEIDVNDVSAGIYFVKTQLGAESIIQKIAIE